MNLYRLVKRTKIKEFTVSEMHILYFLFFRKQVKKLCNKVAMLTVKTVFYFCHFDSYF